MSPSYFRHLFKMETEISFKTYITHLRISQARKLLIATDKSIEEIINDVGYNNVNQFYKVFYRYSHMKPSEYRKFYSQSQEN